MEFKFFRQSKPNNNNYNHHSYQQEKPWHFTYLEGKFLNSVKSAPTNTFSLVEMKKGNWGQVVALPRNGDFPIIGVAVGTYLLVLGTTNHGAVRLQVIGKQVTLARAIAQQVYVRPLYFSN